MAIWARQYGLSLLGFIRLGTNLSQNNLCSLLTFFSLLFLVRKPHRLLAPIILVLGWTVLIVLPILGPTVIQTSKRGSFYGLSGAWCWIGTGYNFERLAYLYVCNGLRNPSRETLHEIC